MLSYINYEVHAMHVKISGYAGALAYPRFSTPRHKTVLCDTNSRVRGGSRVPASSHPVTRDSVICPKLAGTRGLSRTRGFTLLNYVGGIDLPLSGSFSLWKLAGTRRPPRTRGRTQ